MVVSTVLTFQLGYIKGRIDTTKSILHQYQIQLDMDSTYLYEGNRFVGAVPYNDNDGGIDSLILQDNL